MAIQIVQDDERLTYEAEGSEIYYRRISTLRRGRIIKKHTKRGKADWNGITKDILAYVVLGWKAVRLGKKEVPFDADLVPSLPDENLTDILVLSGGSSPEDIEEVPEKN